MALLSTESCRFFPLATGFCLMIYHLVEYSYYKFEDSYHFGLEVLEGCHSQLYYDAVASYTLGCRWLLVIT